MLSKVNKQLSSKFLALNRSFSSFNFRKAYLNLTNRDDTSDPHYRAARFDPLVPLQGHKPTIVTPKSSETHISKLKNGITIVTESPTVPNVVDLGILLDVGTRDETHESSGALLSIKNTYYKTVLKTNETVNYGIVQMSGGNFEMDYDHENTYWKANCLQHDVYDLFQMMADCALEPRSVPSANIGMELNANEHKLQKLLKTGEEFNDSLFNAAYGSHGLGLPLKGLKHNVKYLSSHVLQRFQLENINPERLFVCAGGVENHSEFVDLCEKTLGFMPSTGGSAKTREAAKYHGGELRIATEDNDLKLALAFQSVPWRHDDMIVYNILNHLIGHSDSHTHQKEHHSRAAKHLLNNPKYSFIESANSFNLNFSDTGLFGLTVTGASEHGSEVLQALIDELKGLLNVSNEELSRAKNTLKHHILTAMERQQDRMEETVKNVKTFGRVRCNDYDAEIDKVSIDQVQKAVQRLLASNPTFVAQGQDAGKLISYDKIVSSLRV